MAKYQKPEEIERDIDIAFQRLHCATVVHLQARDELYAKTVERPNYWRLKMKQAEAKAARLERRLEKLKHLLSVMRTPPLPGIPMDTAVPRLTKPRKRRTV